LLKFFDDPLLQNVYIVYHESAGFMFWEGYPTREDFREEFADDINSYQEEDEFDLEEFLDEFEYL